MHHCGLIWHISRFSHHQTIIIIDLLIELFIYSIPSRLLFRKTTNEQKEMKLLLDMYKGVSKEQRDKVQLMAAEKKLRAENEELRQQLKKVSKR